MNHNRNFVYRAVIIVLLSILVLLVFLVACGESPSPTSQILPTSTVNLLTLPIPQTSNNNQPTSTLNFGATSALAGTATAAVFGNTQVAATANDTSQATETVTLSAPSQTSDTANTSTTNSSVPTQNTRPPTPPVGISPAPPPTPPVGVSPAIINNSASIGEQHFQVDLGGFKSDVSFEYPSSKAGPYTTILMFQPYGLYDLDATATTSRFGIGSRNYKAIADQLTLRGYAVVRFTKRGYDASGQFQAPTKDTPIDQLISDADTVLTQVKTNSLVDPRKIILYGQDEGATIAMRLVQKEAANIAGLIMVGPITNPQAAWHYQIVDAPVLYAHNSLDRNKDGLLSVQEWDSATRGTLLASLQNVALNQEKISSLVSVNNNQNADIDLELKPYLEKTFENSSDIFPERADYLASLYKLGDNTQALTAFKKPVMILQGQLDQQVPLSQGENLDNYLAQQNNPDHTIKKYPNLGHNLYKLDKGGADVPGAIDVNLGPPNNPLDDILNWLNTRFS